MAVQKHKDKVELTTTSKKGQVTIPKDVREAVDVETGTKFAVYGSGDTIVMKKVDVPSEEEFEELVEWGAEHREKKGITKEDVLEDD